MRDTLYLVIDDVPYETTTTIGLFTTFAAADAAARQYDAHESPWNLRVEEWAGTARRNSWYLADDKTWREDAL